MTNSDRGPDSQKNTASEGGVVYSGTFNGPIATATGRDGYAANFTVGMPDELIKALRDRLSEARRLLSENHDSEKPADCEKAIAEIDALDNELAGRREDLDSGRLRQRLDRLASALAPVMGAIGGIAAFLDIINGVKSII